MGGGKSSVNQRVVGLDLLRISLAILIFMFHSHIHVLKCDYGLLNYFVNVGAIAMTGFFLLSGFAINYTSNSKDMTNKKEIYRFYIKRLISILPLYYMYALMIIVPNVIIRGLPAIKEELLLMPIETLCIQSVFTSLFPFSHNGGSWFISCILICYFAYPLLNQLTKELKDKNRLFIIIILIMVMLYSPLVQRYFHLHNLYSNPFFRLIEFTLGMQICQLNTNEHATSNIILTFRKPFYLYMSIITLIVGVSVVYYLGVPKDYMLYNWIALPCFMSLLVSLSYMKFERIQNSQVVNYLSALSFSFFLAQIPIVWKIVRYCMEYVGCDNNFLKIMASASICFCIANFLHFCIEKPSAKYLKAKYLN